VLVGSLRNAKATALIAQSYGPNVAVFAAGERWPDDSLRFALEDLLGAGAIISWLATSDTSPEARVAQAAYEAIGGDLRNAIADSTSGQELIARGYREDVDLSVACDASPLAAVLCGDELRGVMPVCAV
jgi:2-phosphosulfolactate phosphatase